MPSLQSRPVGVEANRDWIRKRARRQTRSVVLIFGAGVLCALSTTAAVVAVSAPSGDRGSLVGSAAPSLFAGAPSTDCVPCERVRALADSMENDGNAWGAELIRAALEGREPVRGGP